MPGAKIVFDVKSSQALEDEIKAHGGVPVMWMSGHSLMKAKMREINSPLGGEVSGHMFIGEDYYGFDDAPLVALKVLEILSKTNKSFSDLIGEMPKLVATNNLAGKRITPAKHLTGRIEISGADGFANPCAAHRLAVE